MKQTKMISVTLLALMLIFITACGQNSNVSSNKSKEESPASTQGDNTNKGEEAPAKDVKLRMTWWGNQARADLTLQVIDLFENKYPHISIEAEYMSQETYGDKLKTQIAGKSEPDLIIMGNDYVDYASRGVLLELDPYVGNEVSLDKLDATSVEPGRMDGKLYGLNLGNNGIGLLYNKDMIKNAGLEMPEAMDWTELEEFSKKLVDALGKGKYAFADQSGDNSYFEYFLRQKGKALNADGKVGFTAEDVEEWLTMWDNFRKAGVVPTAEVTAANLDINAETSTVIKGITAMVFRYLNQLPAYQNATQEELDLAALPNGPQGSQDGEWLHPGQFITVSANSKNPKEAAMFASFIVNDPEATSILGNDRGISISPEARAANMSKLSPPEVKMVQYFEKEISNKGKLPKQMPAGAWNGALNNAAQKVAFGQATPADAANEVYEAAAATLK